MNQPLNVKTVIVPAGQNKYGCDVVRFTADYAASDLFEVCIGCYPLFQNNKRRCRSGQRARRSAYYCVLYDIPC